ncbi:MAG: phosphatidylserine decarboxylase [Syntrophaceae bacterium]|nr:phosphatidylserine decarboxylase [Syntrophaceae bacterium]
MVHEEGVYLALLTSIRLPLTNKNSPPILPTPRKQCLTKQMDRSTPRRFVVGLFCIIICSGFACSYARASNDSADSPCQGSINDLKAAYAGNPEFKKLLNTISSIVFESKFQNITKPVPVKRGEELGHFLYGGSLFIMIFEPDRYKSDAIQVRLGNQIGLFDTKKE